LSLELEGLNYPSKPQHQSNGIVKQIHPTVQWKF
jgi:hypothetical protein